MKSPISARGSSGSARPTPPPVALEIVHASGRCSPATPRNLARALAAHDPQEHRKALRQWRREKLAELRQSLENRAAARSVQREIAEAEREHRRTALQRVARVRAKKEKGRAPEQRIGRGAPRVRNPKTQPSSWFVDADGLTGVIYRQSYIGRNSPNFAPGIARVHFYYIIRDGAVLLDQDGLPIVITNLGKKVDEVAAAWDAIEQATTRANGKIQTRIVLPLPADASVEEMVDAVTKFAERTFGSVGVAYTAALHQPSDEGDERNWHAHLLVNLRPIERVAPYEWALSSEVVGELDGKHGLQLCRHLWAHALSDAAESAGRSARYTGLSYGARGLPLETGEHLGPALSAIERRGDHVAKAERNRGKAARNQLRMRLRDNDAKRTALATLAAEAAARTFGPRWEGAASSEMVRPGRWRAPDGLADEIPRTGAKWPPQGEPAGVEAPRWPRLRQQVPVSSLRWSPRVPSPTSDRLRWSPSESGRPTRFAASARPYLPLRWPNTSTDPSQSLPGWRRAGLASIEPQSQWQATQPAQGGGPKAWRSPQPVMPSPFAALVQSELDRLAVLWLMERDMEDAVRKRERDRAAQRETAKAAMTDLVESDDERALIRAAIEAQRLKREALTKLDRAKPVNLPTQRPGNEPRQTRPPSRRADNDRSR